MNKIYVFGHCEYDEPFMGNESYEEYSVVISNNLEEAIRLYIIKNFLDEDKILKDPSLRYNIYDLTNTGCVTLDYLTSRSVMEDLKLTNKNEK